MQVMSEKLCQVGDSRFLLKPRAGVAVWLCRPASQRGGGTRLAVFCSPWGAGTGAHGRVRSITSSIALVKASRVTCLFR